VANVRENIVDEFVTAIRSVGSTKIRTVYSELGRALSADQDKFPAAVVIPGEDTVDIEGSSFGQKHSHEYPAFKIVILSNSSTYDVETLLGLVHAKIVADGAIASADVVLRTTTNKDVEYSLPDELETIEVVYKVTFETDEDGA